MMLRAYGGDMHSLGTDVAGNFRILASAIVPAV